jgi:HPt (histidine-containing phosphotransfer) domain-containing protein
VGPTGADPTAAFAHLCERFVAGLPQRWAEIVGAPDAATRAAALHRLAGAAGAYGFEAIGAEARQAEQALHAGDDAACRDALARLRDRLADAGVTVR